jgi:hypothetical protein
MLIGRLATDTTRMMSLGCDHDIERKQLQFQGAVLPERLGDELPGSVASIMNKSERMLS